MQDRAQRVLVVDHDENLRATLVAGLERAGFQTAQAATAADAKRIIEWADDLDLVVCEMALPDGSGLDLLRMAPAPMILMSDYADETDRVVGLELGADDVVSKPCSARELVARSRAVLRRTGGRLHRPAPAAQAAPANSLTFGQLEIDAVSREVVGAGSAIHLTRMEFDLLHWLAEHPRQVFTKTHLLRAVWGCEEGWVNEATVTEHVRRVRRKLEEATDEAWIATVWGVGYRFEPPAPAGATVQHLRRAV